MVVVDVVVVVSGATDESTVGAAVVVGADDVVGATDVTSSRTSITTPSASSSVA